MNKRVLILAAHPDDEVLGCGGAILKHVKSGDQVHIIFLADGETSRMGVRQGALKQRRKATDLACKILGVKSYHFIDFPDNRLDSIPLLDVVQKVEKLFSKINPSIVYTHHYGDLNIDHRIANAVVMTLCRPLPESSVEEILTFEVMSSTEWGVTSVTPFTPNVFINISDELQDKMHALEAYANEMREFPHSRSVMHIQSLATHRGCCVGFSAAEGFMLIRSLRT